MSFVGTKAPDFEAPAVINGNEIIEKFSLKNYIGEKEVLLFFYPKDFTFVCPTELIAFQEYLQEFEDRGVQVVGCSTDTENSHHAWLNTPIEKGGIQGVTYPLVADITKTISANYEVLGGDWIYNENDALEFRGLPFAYRGTFLIDKKGIVRHQTVNDLPIGRNIGEMLRVIDMWHHVNNYGEVCPANWTKGKRAMKATPKGTAEYMSQYLEDQYIMEASKDGCCSGSCGC
ncbi:MAG: peroxiredoxin [Bacteroidetes bacterium]|nr:peroxiredoxin [Bacteroidota bacterium]